MSLAQLAHAHPVAVYGPIVLAAGALVTMTTYSVLTLERKRSVMPLVVVILLGFLVPSELRAPIFIAALCGAVLGLLFGIIAGHVFPREQSVFLKTPTPPNFDPAER